MVASICDGSSFILPGHALRSWMLGHKPRNTGPNDQHHIRRTEHPSLLEIFNLFTKKIMEISTGRFLSLRETLDTPEGYGELDSRLLQKMGYVLVSNTPEEILYAALDTLNSIHVGNASHDDINEAIRRVRNDFYFSSSGHFNKSFVDRNPWWI